LCVDLGNDPVPSQEEFYSLLGQKKIRPIDLPKYWFTEISLKTGRPVEHIWHGKFFSILVATSADGEEAVTRYGSVQPDRQSFSSFSGRTRDAESFQYKVEKQFSDENKMTEKGGAVSSCIGIMHSDMGGYLEKFSGSPYRDHIFSIQSARGVALAKLPKQLQGHLEVGG